MTGENMMELPTQEDVTRALAMSDEELTRQVASGINANWRLRDGFEGIDAASHPAADLQERVRQRLERLLVEHEGLRDKLCATYCKLKDKPIGELAFALLAILVAESVVEGGPWLGAFAVFLVKMGILKTMCKCK